MYVEAKWLYIGCKSFIAENFNLILWRWILIIRVLFKSILCFIFLHNMMISTTYMISTLYNFPITWLIYLLPSVWYQLCIWPLDNWINMNIWLNVFWYLFYHLSLSHELFMANKTYFLLVCCLISIRNYAPFSYCASYKSIKIKLLLHYFGIENTQLQFLRICFLNHVGTMFVFHFYKMLKLLFVSIN